MFQRAARPKPGVPHPTVSPPVPVDNVGSTGVVASAVHARAAPAVLRGNVQPNRTPLVVAPPRAEVTPVAAPNAVACARRSAEIASDSSFCLGLEFRYF